VPEDGQADGDAAEGWPPVRLLRQLEQRAVEPAGLRRVELDRSICEEDADQREDGAARGGRRRRSQAASFVRFRSAAPCAGASRACRSGRDSRSSRPRRRTRRDGEDQLASERQPEDAGRPLLLSPLVPGEPSIVFVASTASSAYQAPTQR
jgi:hypothetical protein